MINFESFTLDNGLKVIVHEDHTAPLAVLNVMYHVGSKDESPEKTGFAHLFEHLMFGGSLNIPDYDSELQKVGGENNAFTNTDITNYYIQLPSANLETAFWLESDRMLQLAFNQESLDVQRKVVIEEFKQNYLNQPYGDAMLHLRDLAYEKHPYKWPTIGKDVKHIEQATLEDVKNFFNSFYLPNNAVLVVAGDVTPDQVKSLSERWFGPIESKPSGKRILPQEPEEKQPKSTSLTREVPMHALYKAFHIPARNDPYYHTADLLSDILGRGKSSRLNERLVKQEQLFNNIQAYVTGSLDPGLLIITGRLNNDIEFNEAENEINSIIDELKNDKIDNEELQKVKNQAESTHVFAEVELLSRAVNLAYFTILGCTEWINNEPDKIQSINVNDIHKMANQIFDASNSTTLYYKKAE